MHADRTMAAYDPPQQPPPHDPSDDEETIPPSKARGSMPGEDMPVLPGTVEGFQIVGMIASGGMGAVYEAVQEEPRRRVALKMIRPGRTSRALLARFQFEAQVLARLRHPNIAQIYQAGTWQSPEGEMPYFAMEYVPNALPITDYAAKHDLDLRERLVLFMKICDAVHHGHLKGVVHRDLKPANILVGGSGEPKLIDFGVARATDSDQASITQMTNIGQLIGTMQYMSPEQCDADPDDIDARSDVYSLGVVMYELLSEHLPYDLDEIAMHEMVRVIKEEEPTRLSTLHAQLAGDVDTIARKALEKTRARRYQSALELRSDIGRFLDDEPVLAQPASRLYLMRKFARRHRTLVSCSAIIALLVIAGLVSTSIGLSIISRQRNDLATANTELQKQVGMAATLGGDIYSRLQRIDASLDIRREIAQLVLERADALHAMGLDDTLDRESADTLTLSRIRARMDVGDVLGGCRGAYTNLGRPLDAQPLYEEAASLLSAWRMSDPDHPEATRVFIELRTRDGDVRFLTGAHGQAIPHYEDALRFGRDLIDRELARIAHVRLTSQAAMRLADCHAELEDLDAVLVSTRDAHALIDSIDPGTWGEHADGIRRDLALILRQQGFALFEQTLAADGRTEARTRARPLYEESLGHFEALSRGEPANGRAARDWAWSRYYLAYLEANGGDEPRGRRELDAGVDLLLSQLQRNPDDADARADMLSYIEQCAALEPYLGGPPLARDACTRILEGMSDIQAGRPDDHALKRLLTQIERLQEQSSASADQAAG